MNVKIKDDWKNGKRCELFVSPLFGAPFWSWSKQTRPNAHARVTGVQMVVSYLRKYRSVQAHLYTSGRVPDTSILSRLLAIGRQQCKSVIETLHGDFCLSLPCFSRDQTASSAQPPHTRVIHPSRKEEFPRNATWRMFLNPIMSTCWARSQSYGQRLLASCLSARSSAWSNSATTGRNCMKVDVRIFRKSVQKSQVTLKSDKD